MKAERYQLKASQPENVAQKYFPPREVEPRRVELFDFSAQVPIEIAPPIISELAAASVA